MGVKPREDEGDKHTRLRAWPHLHLLQTRPKSPVPKSTAQPKLPYGTAGGARCRHSPPRTRPQTPSSARPQSSNREITWRLNLKKRWKKGIAPYYLLGIYDLKQKQWGNFLLLHRSPGLFNPRWSKRGKNQQLQSPASLGCLAPGDAQEHSGEQNKKLKLMWRMV